MSLQKDFTSSLWFHIVVRYQAIWLRKEIHQVGGPWCKGEVVAHGRGGKIEENQRQEQKEFRNR
jgi:hypothetical protein